jgi:AcrR family transcriptional regulator
MGRPKGFIREKILEQSILVFSKQGYAQSSLHDLESATGVNKSGLYSEFRSKEDLFLASLSHYIATVGAKELLMREPLGWNNITAFLALSSDCQGCFIANSVREISILPNGAREIIESHIANMNSLIFQNLLNEMPKKEALIKTGLILTFNTGLRLEENLSPKSSLTKKRLDFLKIIGGD